MNEKNQSLTKEMFKKDTRYAFTINPSKQHYKNSIVRARYEMEHFQKVFKRKLEPFCTYKLYPEISKKGRWHYHGYLKIHDVFGFHAVSLPILDDNSKYEIDVINDESIWAIYTQKDDKVMKPAMQSRGLPYPLCHDSKLSYQPQPLLHEVLVCDECIDDSCLDREFIYDS